MPISFIRESKPQQYIVAEERKPACIHLHSFAYGMKLRGFSPGCQPQEGLFGTIGKEAVEKTKYHDILLYNRRLTKQEREDYDLDELLFTADITIL